MNKNHPAEHVLVIDDDPIIGELLSLLLNGDGHTVLTADSGTAALKLLGELDPAQRPSVMLSDLNMPGLSPAALAKRLRRACPAPTLLVAMSGSNPTAETLALFDGFLLKPFTAKEFTAAIALARSEIGAATATRPPTKPGTPATQVLNESIFAKLLSVMGETQMQQIYTLFLDDAVVRISRMNAATEAGDAAALVLTAHSLKGGCGMLGATELHSLADRVEEGGLECSLLLNDFGPALERLRRILDEHITPSIGLLSEVIES